jgi:DnaJ domain/TPR repeat
MDPSFGDSSKGEPSLGGGHPRAPVKTLYDVLGARPGDDVESLKNAFRLAVKASHPDLHTGDPDAPMRFRQIVRAHAILSNVEQRAAYDQFMAFEAWQLRPKSKRSVFAEAMRNIASDAIAVAVLVVLLAGGYALFTHVSTRAVATADVIETSAHGSADVAAVRPLPGTGPTVQDARRDKLAALRLSNEAIVPTAFAGVAPGGGSQANPHGGSGEIAAVQPAARAETTGQNEPRNTIDSLLPEEAFATSGGGAQAMADGEPAKEPIKTAAVEPAVRTDTASREEPHNTPEGLGAQAVAHGDLDKVAAAQPAEQTDTTGREEPRDKLESLGIADRAIAASGGAHAIADGEAAKIAAIQPAEQIDRTGREEPRDGLDRLELPDHAIVSTPAGAARSGSVEALAQSEPAKIPLPAIRPEVGTDTTGSDAAPGQGLPNAAIAPSAVAPAAKDGGAPAMANGEPAPDLQPNDAKSFRERGIASYRRGDFRAAIADLDQAIRIDPTFESAYIDRGTVFYAMQEFDRAFADIAQAKRLANSHRTATPASKPLKVSP